MPSKTKYYLVEYDGSTPAIRDSAFTFAFEICSERRIQDIYVVTEDNGLLNGIGSANPVIESGIETLAKGQAWNHKSFRINHLVMKGSSKKEFKTDESYDFVIALFLSPKDMIKVASATTKGILYLPSGEEEGRNWQACWEPEVYGDSTWNARPYEYPKGAKEGLEKLFKNKKLNLASGLTHPLDEGAAQKALAPLKRANQSDELPDELREIASHAIFAWARREGWPAKAAEKLMKMARPPRK